MPQLTPLNSPIKSFANRPNFLSSLIKNCKYFLAIELNCRNTETMGQIVSNMLRIQCPVVVNRESFKVHRTEQIVSIHQSKHFFLVSRRCARSHTMEVIGIERSSNCNLTEIQNMSIDNFTVVQEKCSHATTFKLTFSSKPSSFVISVSSGLLQY